MHISGKLVGRIARDCGISENEVAKRLVEVAGRRASNKHNAPPMMMAWGQEWKPNHLATVTGINLRTLTYRWERGVRFPELVARPTAKYSQRQAELTDREILSEEEALMRDAEACDRLLELLRQHHPELEAVEDEHGEQTHTASGVINGARYRNAAFIGARSTGYMEAI